MKSETCLHWQRAGRDRITKADHSGLVSCGFQKQDYLRDLSWATILDFSTYPPNLKICMTSPNLVQLPTPGALTGFHHVPGIDGFSTLLSKRCVLGLAQGGGKWSTHSKNRGGSGDPCPAGGSNQLSHILSDLPQQWHSQSFADKGRQAKHFPSSLPTPVLLAGVEHTRCSAFLFQFSYCKQTSFSPSI